MDVGARWRYAMCYYSSELAIKRHYVKILKLPASATGRTSVCQLVCGTKHDKPATY